MCLKSYTCFNCFDIEQSIAQVNEPLHLWTSQLIRSAKSFFGVRRVNKTKVRGAYLKWGRSKVFYHDFFGPGHTNKYRDKTIPY